MLCSTSSVIFSSGLQQAPCSSNLPLRPSRPRDAALPAESAAAARPLPQSRRWVGLGRTRQPPSSRRSSSRSSIHSSSLCGPPPGAAVSPGHTPAEGAHGAPQLAPGRQGVHLQPPSVRAHLPAARAAQVRVHSHSSRWVNWTEG